MFRNNKMMIKTWQMQGLAALRIIVGLLMAYHGLEVFDAAKIEEYAKWESIKSLPSPLLMVYIGKGLELVTGALVAVGLFTRAAALVMAVNMFVVCFKIATGKFYYEDQHPFLFGLVGLIFFFIGPVLWSLDQLISKKRRNGYTQ